MDKESVLVIDELTLFRAGLRHLLDQTDDLVVVGEASDRMSALEQVSELKPALIIIGLNHDTIEGVEIINQMLSIKPDACIIVVTHSRDARAAARAIVAGARGYVPNEVASDTLVYAIRAARHQMLTLDFEVGRELIRSYLQLCPPGGLNLKANERLLLRELCRGKSNRTIAEALGWPEQTVKNRLSLIYRKLGVNRRSEAIAQAVGRKLLDDLLRR